MHRKNTFRRRALPFIAGGLGIIALATMQISFAGTQPMDSEHALPQPMRTALQLAQGGAPLRGEALAWSELGVRFLPQGEEFARLVLWSDLTSAAAYNLRRRFIERDDAPGWLGLGVLMLEMGDARRAEQALRVATRLDEALEPVANRARELFKQGGDPREALADDATAKPTSDSASERSKARPIRSPPTQGEDELAWPTLSDAEHAQATEEMKQRCAQFFERAAMPVMPFVETEHFLVFSDMAPSERGAAIQQLETMYKTLRESLEIPADVRMYHGKCAVFIFNTRDRFQLFEARVFNNNASGAAGVFHSRGPWTHIVFFKLGSQDSFRSTLVHEGTHSFMYRHHSSRGLPTWANEGLADYIAGRVNPAAVEPGAHWALAKQFVLQGGDPHEIMRQSYRDGSWGSENSYPVSHMLVRFLLKHEPREFKGWIDAIKAGAKWEEALEEHFGVSADVLARGFADAIRNEPHYAP